MTYGTLKDYAPRLGMFPTYKAPKYLGSDAEFANFEFIVPHAWRADTHEDHSGVLPEGWMIDMVSLPVMMGIEQTKSDDTFTYFKCKVPLFIMKSHLGMAYFAPQMRTSNDMPPPSPDHVKATSIALEKAKDKTYFEADQYEIKLACDCGQEITEVHKTATEGLVARYCGECRNPKLKLVSLKPIKPQDD